MPSLNTQLGYQKPRPRSYGLPGAARQAAPGASSGVTRALAGVAQPPPAAPSYTNPYDPVNDPTGTLFTAQNYPTVQPTAPASTPSTYTAQHPQAPAAPPGYTFDLETDPILQQIHATAARQRTEAEAGALEQRKQLAIQYGDQAYGDSIDPNTGRAAAQNPFSITRNLANQYETQGHNLNENLNSHNLFYSGERINELAQALKDYQQQQAVAAGQFQQGLGVIGQNRVGALMGADQAEQGGYNDAWARALAWALAHPGVPGGGAGAGTATPPNSQPPAIPPGALGGNTTVGGGGYIAPGGILAPGGAAGAPRIPQTVDPNAVPPSLLRALARVR